MGGPSPSPDDPECAPRGGGAWDHVPPGQFRIESRTRGRQRLRRDGGRPASERRIHHAAGGGLVPGLESRVQPSLLPRVRGLLDAVRRRRGTQSLDDQVRVPPLEPRHGVRRMVGYERPVRSSQGALRCRRGRPRSHPLVRERDGVQREFPHNPFRPDDLVDPEEPQGWALHRPCGTPRGCGLPDEGRHGLVLPHRGARRPRLAVPLHGVEGVP